MPLRKPHKRPADGAEQQRSEPQAVRPRIELDTAESADPLVAEIERLREQLRRSEARAERLEKRAHEDALTGLLNRRGFAKAFEKAVAYGRRYRASAALLFFDLDRFKQINDEHGHAAGDIVLAEVARLISRSLRASDIVARIGGDEMVALLWHAGALQAEAKARALERLIDAVEFEAAGRKFAAGLSAGFTMLLEDDTLEATLQRADEAMYARKKERRYFR